MNPETGLPNEDALPEGRTLDVTKNHGVPAPCVMVLGTSSGAGKSWIATALCRHYANRGLRVAPFKAQNMSNNVRIVRGRSARLQEDGEMGSAQYFQALAARAVPDVRMSPLLLKPEADTHSSVVLMGQPDEALSALPWRGRSERVWPQIAAALDALRAENDVVVIEGAGSPAEINLMSSDVVNLRVARHADAHCLLVTDIDRGGAFAHLYGTWALLPPDDRARIRGFVLNKFRGDAALLAPASELLEQRTGVRTVAVVPMQRGHGLPEEDGVFDDGSGLVPAGARVCRIAVIAYPRISHLDEFQPLRAMPGVHLVWAHEVAALADVDWIVLPGSQAVVSDLAWLRAQSMDHAVLKHAVSGGRVLGLGAGLQILGECLDGKQGLGLLPVLSSSSPFGVGHQVKTRFGAVEGAWSALSSVPLSGHKLGGGSITSHLASGADGHEVVPNLAWQSAVGNVLGVNLHGLFEDDHVLQSLFGVRAPALDAVFDRLAATIGQAFEPDVLDALIDQRFPDGT